MPVPLREAKIGEVLRPPKTAMYSWTGQLVVWEREYVVIRKDPKNNSVWLNAKLFFVEYVLPDGKKMKLPAETLTEEGKRLGSIQMNEDSVWLYPSEPKPTDAVRIIRRGETTEEEPKRRRGDPETEYEFAFDDEEIKLDDMPAQAQILADIFLEIFNQTGKNAWSEKEIDEILHQEENVERLHTSQNPMSIFKFYRAKYARKGFIKRRD